MINESPSLGSDDLTIMVLAKEPRAGQVKTRLTPDFTPEQAAALAAAAIQDTLQVVLATAAKRRILVLDGNPGDWIPAGFEVLPQAPGGLDERLAAAFAAVTGPAILIGMDTPQLQPEDLRVDFETADAWFGPCFDGGFWLVGMKIPDPSVFVGVPMSTSDTGRIQLDRLRSAGMQVQCLTTHQDVDTADDARTVAALAPHTRFAAQWRAAGDSSTWPSSSVIYQRALRDGTNFDLVAAGDRRLPMDTSRWLARADIADTTLLDRCEGPTLDVGCGPGRLAAALSARGISSLGVDLDPVAVRLAQRAGAYALCRSVFDRLPGEGLWGTVLLVDGNIGLDGDPARLLGRIRKLLCKNGLLLVESSCVDDEHDDVVRVQLCDGTAARSTPFLWGHLGPAATRQRVEAAGYSCLETWSSAGRTFLAFRADHSAALTASFPAPTHAETSALG